MSEINDALSAIDAAARADRNAEAAAKAMSQARIDLVLGKDAKAVYFATIAMRLKLAAEAGLPTAATDGKSILYNPEYVVGLNRHESVGLSAHETMHVSNAHHARMGDRNPKRWNIACDLAINHILDDAGFVLPPGALFPGKGLFKDLPVGLSAEEYYTLVPKVPKELEGDGDDPGGCGGVRKPGKGSDAECRKAEAEAKEMVAAAEQAVKASGRGTLPRGIARSVRDLLEPKADWKAILREFVSRYAKNDYSWVRPNRRSAYLGIHLPGLHSEELGEIVLTVDLSGSIGQAEMDRFGGEVQGILESYDCTLTILYHDTAVHKVETWRSTDGPLRLESGGGGGTSHVEVFDRIASEGLDPACVVCLTDMDTVFPADPGIATLWCDVGRRPQEAPWGRTVHVEV